MSDFLSFINDFSTYTGGAGVPVIIFIMGLTPFFVFKQEIGNGLIASGFLMSLLSFLFYFAGFLNEVLMLIFFGIFIMSLIMKVVLRW